MHQIVPYHKWRSKYAVEEDEKSPFYGRSYDYMTYSKKIYNYFIHSEWDEFGSNTLYAKILFTDYEEGYTIIELMGEWNDCLYNDVMFLKREIIDILNKQNISKYIILCDNVLNFHASDDSYYEEWWDDVKDEDGTIIFLNTRQHVWEEMQEVNLQYYVNFGEYYNDYEWRKKQAKNVYEEILEMRNMETKQLG